MSSTFLTCEDLEKLTGRKVKSKQIEALKKMAVPFLVNATGHPVVARSAIDRTVIVKAKPEKAAWVPRVLKAG